jgi:hypothetical protein
VRHVYLVFLLSVTIYAQTSAGGKWTVGSAKDAMTDAPHDVFILDAESPIKDGMVTATPNLSIVCASGHFRGAMFDAGVVLGGTSHESTKFMSQFQPRQQDVRVRLDRKIEFMSWDTMSTVKELAIGKHDLEKILKAKDVRIEFSIFASAGAVAAFQPAGLDRDKLERSCGVKF